MKLMRIREKVETIVTSQSICFPFSQRESNEHGRSTVVVESLYVNKPGVTDSEMIALVPLVHSKEDDQNNQRFIVYSMHGKYIWRESL